MARHKAIHPLIWKGEIMEGDRDLILVLYPPADPAQRIFFALSPTGAKRVLRPLEDLIHRAELEDLSQKTVVDDLFERSEAN